MSTKPGQLPPSDAEADDHPKIECVGSMSIPNELVPVLDELTVLRELTALRGHVGREILGTPDGLVLGEPLSPPPPIPEGETHSFGPARTRELNPLDPTLPSNCAPDLLAALRATGTVHRGYDVAPVRFEVDETLDEFAAQTLVVARSARRREAISTALLGDWSTSLWTVGHLPLAAFSSLKTDIDEVHRQLVPLWRRRTRHGRVLSLDAALGDGLSLHDLVAADVDLLARVTDGVYEDERLNRVLRSLCPAERLAVLAYAEGDGTTWTEAAAITGAADPDAFGERVRRKVKRLAAEQRRRIAQTQMGISQESLPVGLEPGTER
ncbi:hypothetical protein [Streptomyces europaeiscabiei]|uniref:hypothetical protein n=1 Tax=Streptomyces europaeiscabiei TaxID=146819 RepID=UPI0013C47625|nr:hypothetical protein [Streptomyces europaeiscabiei]